ncbi:MAG: InlB B-repeat-containing protein [Chitinispirillales bacterium]|jgi:uncharacterized protein (TIGR02145 family)/uncharacterized repeat protein (TIGR02543 family)|nr:InlB B-repeat-containing protein [Chitinispirillales bacterium]
MTVFKKNIYKFGGLLASLIAIASFSTCEKVPDHCGRFERYDPEFQFCFAGKAHNLCAGSNFNPLVEGCIANNAVGTRCLNDTFVPTGTPCAGFTLSTAAAPADGGLVMRTPDRQSYSAEEEVIVTATAADGYEFAGWAGAATSASSSITVTMNSNRPLVAMFNPISEPGATTHRLVTTAFPENGGTITRNPNAPYYSPGTEITLTATAAAGFAFAGWSGAATDTSSTILFTMADASQTLVAMFSPITYTFTVNTEPAASGTVFINRTASSGTTRQYAGAVEALAQPAEGYVFTMWSGAVSSGVNPITVNIANNNQTLIANFRQQAGQHALTVVAGDGGTVTGGGTFNEGTHAPITATPDSGCAFSGWTPEEGVADPDSDNTTVLMMTNRTVIANFDCGEEIIDNPVTYTLIVNAGAGGTAAGGGTFSQGTNASITATVTGDGCTFSGWTPTEGVADSSAANTTILMVNDRTVTANFDCEVEPTTYVLTVTASPTSCATALTGGGSHNAGTDVPISVTAAANCTFTGWAGATGITNANSITSASVLMDAAKTVTANFTQQQDTSGGHGHFNPAISYGSFTDDRDGRVYRTVVIGTQTWMAENLNWSGVDGDLGWCYGNDSDHCETYGRLYDWSMVMGFASSCNSSLCADQVQSLHQGICPAGWHVPSDAEWTTLVNFVGGLSVAGTRLRALTGWGDPWSGTLIPGTDDHGFSALPGGYRWSGSFINVGMGGVWWSASEDDATYARHRSMGSSNSGVSTGWNLKTDGFSLRCVRTEN